MRDDGTSIFPFPNLSFLKRPTKSKTDSDSDFSTFFSPFPESSLFYSSFYGESSLKGLDLFSF